ncbi:MAG: HlyD family secretion protein [Alphaproteobacteria bacterium]|nr:HlyD family secretion protein [Alphaproteobacteria bacterium]
MATAPRPTPRLNEGGAGARAERGFDPLVDVIPSAAPRRRVSGRHVRYGVVAIVAVLGAVGLGSWMHDRFTHVYINDARIAADLIAISSRVPGRVAEMMVSSGEMVTSGQVLAAIDVQQAEFRLAELDAQLKSIAAERDKLAAQADLADRQTASAAAAARSRKAAAEATLAGLASDLTLARSALERTEALLGNRIVAQQRVDADRAAFERARQAHERGRAEIDVAAATLLQAEADRRQLVVLRHQAEALSQREEELRVQINRQRVEIEDHRIKSPIEGVVDGVFVKPGEFVTAGQRLLLVHSPNEVWVDANVKETEIRHLKVGRRVKVTIDAYPGEIFEGTIARVGHAATSQFALLPNPNPSGNFTKVTQRLPVKIAVAQRDGKLRPGMMVEVVVDVDG